VLNISPQELILILVVALLVVGPRKLPELGRSLGKGLREIRKAQDEVRKTVQVNLDQGERPTPASRAPGASASLPEEAAGRAPAAGQPSAVSEISKTLGRGLGEIRRARQEVERTFRVDLNEGDEASRSPRSPRQAPAGTHEPSGADSDAGDASDEGVRPD
jgi:sec-independent protein translocase protein TatA